MTTSIQTPRKVLIYDTETNKQILWGERNSNPLQPHIVQIAAALYDAETRKPQASLNMIVKPTDWDIDEETVDIHGITLAHASQFGVDEEGALTAFWTLWQEADLRVAHSESFDARIINIALRRFATQAETDKWNAGAGFCTMQSSRKMCGLFDKAGRKNKAPKLTEAYEHFMGVPMPNAHTAHGDVRGCAAVYWAILAGMEEEQKDEHGIGNMFD